jgi:hypothetical protein
LVPSAPLVRRRIAALGAPVGFGERGGRGGSPALPCMRWPEPITCEPMYEPIIAPLRPINVCDWDRRIARIASVAAVSGDTYLMGVDTASAYDLLNADVVGAPGCSAMVSGGGDLGGVYREDRRRVAFVRSRALRSAPFDTDA